MSVVKYILDDCVSMKSYTIVISCSLHHIVHIALLKQIQIEHSIAYHSHLVEEINEHEHVDSGDSDDTHTDDGDDIGWLDWICYTMYVNKFIPFSFPENGKVP